MAIDLTDPIFALFHWIGENGYTTTGPLHELHLFGRTVDMPDRQAPVLVEVQVPVAKSPV